jgi:hypothetical protein
MHMVMTADSSAEIAAKINISRQVISPSHKASPCIVPSLLPFQRSAPSFAPPRQNDVARSVVAESQHPAAIRVTLCPQAPKKSETDDL